MDAKLQSVLDKIARLRALAAGSTSQAEAEAAAAQAAALIAKYQIDEAQIETPDATRTEEVGAEEEPLYRDQKRDEKWRSTLAAGLAEIHGCAVLYGSAVGYTRYRIAGRPSDVAIVRYLFAWLHVEIARLSKGERGKAAKNAFRIGAVFGVIRAMVRARRAEEAAVPAGATMALAMVDRVKLSFDALMGEKKPRTAALPKATDRDALVRGLRAGGAIAPKQALTAGDGTLLLT